MIKKLLLATMAVATITGCAVLGGGDPLVVTTRDNVVEEHREDAASIPTESLPSDIAEIIPEGTDLVLVEPDQVLDPQAPAVTFPSEGGMDDTTFDTLLTAGMELGKGFIPGLAAWEGILLLLSRRKRKHYLDATKKAAPVDGAVDLAGAVKSVAAALGATHSSPSTEEVWEEEREMEKELA